MTLSGAARSLEGELGGGISAEGVRLSQILQDAWEQLEPAKPSAPGTTDEP